MNMKETSRRTLLVSGTCALGATAFAPELASAYAGTGMGSKSEETIRKYYTAWEKKDWGSLDALLADSFTFSSAAGDDHIPTSAYKAQCWDTQSPLIERFDLLRVFAVGSEAFVMYICHIRSGKTFRNVEYFRLKDDKVEAVECYFGAVAGYPTAAEAK
jgi:ketosteroid isomerase-like protein